MDPEPKDPSPTPDPARPDSAPRDPAATELAALRSALEGSEQARRRSDHDLRELLERRSVRFARSLSASQHRLSGILRLARGTGKSPRERFHLARRLLREVGPRQFLSLLSAYSRPEETRAIPIPPEADAPPPEILSADAPWISVLVPVCDPAPEHLSAALASLEAQSYRGYELILIDDASSDERVTALLEAVASEATLITLETRGGISRALNAGLERAQGEWVCVLDHDDTLAPHALAWLAWTAAQDPSADLIYSDEDKLDPSGARVQPAYKPGWSPDFLLSINYLCHLTALRRGLVSDVGGFRSAYDGAQDYDLLLRVAPRARSVSHVPKILYHWRQAPGSTALDASAKPHAGPAGARALRDALPLWGLGQRQVSEVPGGGYRLGGTGVAWRVSILIATKDRPDLLLPCLASLRAMTRHAAVEVVVVDNGSVSAAGRAALSEAEAGGARVLSCPGAFNYGRLMNEAAAQTEGEVLLLLNDDTEVRTAGWIQELLAHLDRPGVGAAGPLLRYPNGRIQHAGVLLGIGGVASHAFIGRTAPSHPRARLASNVSALTGACLALRRSAFEEVDGFDAVRLPNSYGDVDLCLRLADAGYRSLFVPTVELLHHEGATRGRAVDVGAQTALRARWGQRIERDPYGHPLVRTTDLTPPW
ncbi:MAG: glycosyltransferase [Planctomycetes bacterium]|nr:glycosyltransferase [Planctomycetota bacterium]